MTTTPSAYPFQFIGGTIEINDVVSIVETDSAQDETTGDWIRDIQIFRAPDEGAVNPTLILTIRLKGDTKSSIYFHAPSQDY